YGGPAEITITTPEDSTLEAGEQITWIPAGTDVNYTVLLMPFDSVERCTDPAVIDIAQSYEGITFNHWEIPSNLEDGDYDLCILAQDFSGAVITDTPFAFSKVSAPEFRITGPVGELKDGENHIAPFTSLAITWEPIQLPGIWQYEVSISMKSGC